MDQPKVVVVVWMDAGKDLSHCKSGPWLSRFPLTEMTRLHPFFQHRSRMALSNNGRKDGPASTERNSIKQQYAHKNYGSYLKIEIMAYDAFYALNELFEFSAASIDQVLEQLEGNISPTSLRHSHTTKLSELLVVKFLVDDYQNYVADSLEIVRNRGNPKWPRTSSLKQREKAGRAACHLEFRYQSALVGAVWTPFRALCKQHHNIDE